MKFSIKSELISIVLISVLFIAGVWIILFSVFGENRNTKAGQKEDHSKTESVDTQEPEDSEDELEKLYMSEGYRVIGGDLYCSHRWDGWILLSPASLKTPGRELRYCTGCRAHQKREFGTLHGAGDMAYIENIKCLLQMPSYPNGCEVVSLTMVLNYYGYDVTTDTLIDMYMPRGVFSTYGDDPFYMYLGNPRDLGVGCYAPCIVTTANNYFSSVGVYGSATDVSGQGFEEYKKLVSNGIPVIFWGTTYMDCNPEIFGTIYTEEREIIWRNHSHCFVLIGYTDTTYIFCDPLRGIVEYPKEDVEKSHSLVYEQACVIKGQNTEKTEG